MRIIRHKPYAARQSGRLLVPERSEEGQMVLFVLLATIVISLIILAVASRSLTDVGISRSSDDSARAFSAAEAGIEAAVGSIRELENANSIGTLPAQSNVPLIGSGANYSYTTEKAQGSNAYLSATQLSADVQIFQVYLVDRSDLVSSPYSANTICLLWGNQGTTDNPMLEVTLIYNSGGTMALGRTLLSAGVDPACPQTISRTENNLGVDRTFAYTNHFSFTGINPLLLRMRLLKSPATAHYLGVSPRSGGQLPTQGYKITSTGTSGTSLRKVEVFQAYPALPALFDFALYNGSSDTVTK